MTTPQPSERDLNLTGIAARLRALNPGFTNVRVEAPRAPGAAVRVIVETTRAELAAVGGQLHLTDPELEGLQLETSVRFLDLKPGERMNVQLRPNQPQPRDKKGRTRS